MQDLGYDAAAGGASGATVEPRLLGDLQAWRKRLALADDVLTDTQRIDALRALEELKCATEAMQAEITADFEASQRRAAARAGEPAERRSRGVASQIALARRESPHRGQRQLGLATVLRREMPRTRMAFRLGHISEWRATLMVRETACLSLEHRMLIDEEIARDTARIEAMGDRQLIGEIRKRAYELDPRSFTERRRRAESERRVSVRPAPDVMAYLTALLSVKDAVAVQAALTRAYEEANAAGDPRSKDQFMADTLVQRVINPAMAATSLKAAMSLIVNVVVRDSVLLGDEDGAGWVEGYGEVPGDLLREWLADTAEAEERGEAEVWVRRLYEKPETGELVAMDSQARRFLRVLAEFLRLRDRGCRTQYCDAPIRHLDHSVDHALGGPTDARHGQGLCESCNHAKQARGWSARPRPGPRHTIETTTPTGHRYTSTAPTLGAPRRTWRHVYHPGVIAVA